MVFLLFYVTFPDEQTARSICTSMVERGLAACANVFPIRSLFWWEGQVQNEGEYVGILKTRSEFEEPLEAALEAEHPYEVPCFMRYEVRANEKYVQWIYESTVGGV